MGERIECKDCEERGRLAGGKRAQGKNDGGDSSALWFQGRSEGREIPADVAAKGERREETSKGTEEERTKREIDGEIIERKGGRFGQQ